MVGWSKDRTLKDYRWPLGQKSKTQWLTSDEWGCPLDNDPKLAVGQPKSSLKKVKINNKDTKELKVLYVMVNTAKSVTILRRHGSLKILMGISSIFEREL